MYCVAQLDPGAVVEVPKDEVELEAARPTTFLEDVVLWVEVFFDVVSAWADDFLAGVSLWEAAFVVEVCLWVVVLDLVELFLTLFADVLADVFVEEDVFFTDVWSVVPLAATVTVVAVEG